ncbi:MAG TPA: hypothetical protein VMT91_15230 [Anaerolineales bacterium]|nr:hypothetical protein [Anaerolineales bacterium]
MSAKLYRYAFLVILLVIAVSLPLNASASASQAPGKSPSSEQNNPNIPAFNAELQSPLLATSAIRAMQVDYPSYANSRSLVPQWEQNMKSAGINMVFLNAGRTEWTYFKWSGHNANWSSDVTSTGIDFLADDSTRYGQWAQVSALIDILSPNYISAHPDKAAINASGSPSSDLVSTAELVNGAYGQSLLDMVSAIAANYPSVGSITIAELAYHVDGYGADDLALYKAATGKTDWPRNSDGTININDSSIGNWRSAAIGQFLGRAAALAHQNGKQLYVEVGVSVNSLSTATNNYGTNYSVMLQNVDKLVVQGYFGVDGYAAKYCGSIAQYLAKLGTSKTILAIGLWNSSGSAVSSTDLNTAITSSQSGGMPNILVTPESLAASSHFQVLTSLWGSKGTSATSTPTRTATKSSSTNTPTRTATKTSQPANTATKTAAPTNTFTKTSAPTNTPTRTATATPVPTNTATKTSAPTNTPSPTATNTPQPVNTSAATQTFMPSNTPTRTNTPAPSNTPVPTNSPTQAPSSTPTKTSAPVNTPYPTSTQAPTQVVTPTPLRLMSVEYANYATSRSEVPTFTQELQAAGINMVALSAGRPEWTYFKWAGHTANQSSDVTSTGIDFLADDSATYGQFASINAVVDVFSPNYILANPSKAAINASGQPDPNLVSTAELVNGAYGQELLDMIQYIAANYPRVGSISITELSYRVDGYGPDDLALYTAATGNKDWPRNSDGTINIDDPAIGNWRSAVLGQYLNRAAALVHQYGKQLYMDVSVSYGNLGLMTNNMGTNYSVMLQNVDKIVAWDYFALAGYPASYSQNVAQYLATFGLNRVFLSVGLWGPNNTTISAADLQASIQASQAGGMPNIWICPGSMMTSAHWQVLDTLWGPQ